MKKTFIAGTLMLFLATGALAQRVKATANYRVIPLPRQITLTKEAGFTLNGSTKIVYPSTDQVLKRDAELLADYILQLTHHRLSVGTTGDSENVIELSTGLNHANKEAYQLTVHQKKIQIKGASAAGTFYGIQTLRKSIPTDPVPAITFPAAEVTDFPEFGYRGGMLDVARHFFNADEVKKFIDILALHNINNFHWHLTDDQGWRIEIKKYPLLIEKSAFRPETAIGHTMQMDGKPHGGYYTQEQIKEIVRYAADRHINIVPEIDMPGHMVAALAAYPELGCTGGPYKVRTFWGIAEDVLCAGNDKTLQFAKDVIAEVIDLFPGQYINIGGDECPKTAWEKCPRCQAKIEQLGLTTDARHTKEQRLQSCFMSSMANFIASKGRKVVGWDEILEGGVAPNATVLSWRGMEGAEEAARLGHDAIMCPTSHLYFDYYQTEDREHEPVAFNGYIPIERTYSFNPISEKLTASEAKHIIGVQANLWTEQIATFDHAQYMYMPRLAAACEVQWSNPAQRDYNDFIKRLPHMLQMYGRFGYNYGKHYFTVKSEILPSGKKGVVTVKLTSVDGAKIAYSLDGSDPMAHPKWYKGPIEIKKRSTIKAVAVYDLMKSDMYTEEIKMHKALMKPITYNTQPYHAYAGREPAELVNGLAGTTFFHSGRWVGFVSSDLDAVIDMEKQMPIQRVTLRTLVDDGNWIFPDRGVTLSVSDDGVSYKDVYHDSKESMPEGKAAYIQEQKITLQNVKGRYLKIKMLSDRSMPNWHYGKGQPAFLFVDEIIVD